MIINCMLIIFRNYFPDVADDLKIYHAVRDLSDKLMLQNDLITLALWSKDWLLRFNIGKCMVMHLAQYTIDSSYSDYLSVVHESRDLDTYMD